MADDFALLEAWRAGDSTAGSRLLRRYVDPLYHFFVTKVGEVAAEELTQATFEACTQSHARIEQRGTFRAYLLGIARIKLLQHYDEWRRRGSRRQSVEHSLAAEQTSPSGIVARHDEQRLIVAALRRLPLPFQLAVELHYWEELSVEETAQVLEVAPGTVKSRLHRARGMLEVEIRRLAASDGLANSTMQGLSTWIASLRQLRAARQGSDDAGAR